MPVADPAYIIGVIRHKELGLLGEDEYTRLISAETTAESMHVLVDTPYGLWLDADINQRQVFSALNQRLVSLQLWLTDVVESENLLQFIQVRYDALNLASALIEYQQSQSEPGVLSDLGSLSPTTIASLLWHDTGWDLIPEYWEAHLRSAQQSLEAPLPPKWQTNLLLFFQYASLSIADTLALTPLMHKLVELNRDHLILDTLLRQGTTPPDKFPLLGPLAQDLGSHSSLAKIERSLARHGYDKFTEPILTSVRQHGDSQAYELIWDNYLISHLKKFRADPVGLDPILAYWLAQELEVKNIRLLLSAKWQGLNVEKLQSLRRNLYFVQ